MDTGAAEGLNAKRRPLSHQPENRPTQPYARTAINAAMAMAAVYHGRYARSTLASNSSCSSHRAFQDNKNKRAYHGGLRRFSNTQHTMPTFMFTNKL